MKLVLLLASLVWSAEATAFAADYQQLGQAFTNFFATLDTISKDLPYVTSSAGAAHMIEKFTSAGDALCDIVESFPADHPEVYYLTEPPPEFASAIKYFKLRARDGKFGSVIQRLGRVAAPYRSMPKVRQAMQKVRKLQDRFFRLAESARKAAPNKRPIPFEDLQRLSYSPCSKWGMQGQQAVLDCPEPSFDVSGDLNDS